MYEFEDNDFILAKTADTELPGIFYDDPGTDSEEYEEDFSEYEELYDDFSEEELFEEDNLNENPIVSLREFDEKDQEKIASFEEHFKKITEGTNEDIMRRIKNGNLPEYDLEYLKDYIVEKNEALMKWVANRYSKTFLMDDRETNAVAWNGMNKAIQTYDPDYMTADGKPVKFTTYATRCIVREVMAAHKSETRHYSRQVSIETPTAFDKNGKPQRLEDSLADSKLTPDRALDRELAKDAVMEMLWDLDPASRYILVMRYGLFGEHNKTEKEIAAFAQMSQANVSKKETAAKKLLKSKHNGNREYLFSFFA